MAIQIIDRGSEPNNNTGDTLRGGALKINENFAFLNLQKADESDIPTNNNQLTNGANYLTTANIPTNNNQLTNGAGYITSTDKRTKKSISASTYSILASDVDKYIEFSNACVVTVPNGLAADLDFQGEQVGSGQVTFNAESGGTLNVFSGFLKETAGQNCVWGIRTKGSDLSTILGTLKLS
jgi:hypothetical protein